VRPTFLIAHHNRPWQVLFVSTDLEQAAQSLVAQSNVNELHVYASDGGQSRELTTNERASLRMLLARASA
jgi:hypothetical protein